MMNDSFDPRYDPSFQRGFDRVRGSTRQADSVTTREPPAGRSDVPAPPLGMVLRGNPFIYALITVGAFLLVFGLWAQWGAAAGATGSYRSPDELVPDAFFASVGPWCMTLGIATLVTVLVLYAVHWRMPT